MKALILIGLQGDFLAGGPMAVPDGDAVIPLAYQLQAAFRLVVATQQWHPANHRSFALNHRGRVAGERVRVARADQILKPTHCVQNTRGAELSPALMRNHINKVMRLGSDQVVSVNLCQFSRTTFAIICWRMRAVRCPLRHRGEKRHERFLVVASPKLQKSAITW